MDWTYEQWRNFKENKNWKDTCNQKELGHVCLIKRNSIFIAVYCVVKFEEVNVEKQMCILQLPV